MTTKKLSDLALSRHPFMFRNNRGCARIGASVVRFGIPEPKGHEKPSDLKGGDYIGIEEIIITPSMVGKSIAVFLNVEIKGEGDKLVEGQIRWHNFIIDHGGISEIWKDGEVINERLG